jgi:fucose 4-O-acetylase-like acetyltransferase
VLGDPAIGGRPDAAVIAAVVAALSLVALPAGLGFAAWLAERWPRLALPLQVIGRSTLVIYVLHTIALRPLMAWVPWDAGPEEALLPLVALAAIALTLLVGRPLERALPVLFALPAPLAGRGRRRRDEAAGATARAG